MSDTQAAALLIAHEAQAEVAGYLLLDPYNTPDADLLIDRARIQRFAPADDITRHVYEAACDGQQGYGAIADTLKGRGLPVDDLPRLMGLATSSVPMHAVARIDEMYERRCLKEAAQRISVAAGDTDQAVDSVVSDGQRLLTSAQIGSRNVGTTGEELIHDYEQPDPKLALYPPVTYVDGGKFLEYLRHVPLVEGSNNLVAAGPGEGKSVLAWNVARIFAYGGAHVCLISYEMTRMGYLDWEHARTTHMPVERLVKARLPRRTPAQPFTDDEAQAIKQAHERIRPWMQNVRFFEGDQAIRLDAAYATLRRLRMRGECDLVIIDHLHNAIVDGRTDIERAQNASILSREIASQLLVPVLSLCQLNRSGRAGDGRGDDQPIRQYQLTDLLNSGRLEADASSVTFLQQVIEDDAGNRYGYVNKKPQPGRRVSMLHQIRKNREAGGYCPDALQEIVAGRFSFVPIPHVAT